MKRIASAALVAILAVACSQKSNSSQDAAAAPAPRPAAQQAATLDLSKLPPGHPTFGTPPAAAASAMAPDAAPQAGVVRGTIAETMNAGGYTYVKIRTGSGDLWAAVTQTKVKKGDPIAVAVQMTLDNFESETLKRKFDHIIFGTLPGEGAAPAAMTSQQTPVVGDMPPAAVSAMGSAAQHMQVRDSGDINVPKAEGGKTVAEVWSSKDALKEKQVVVRGKVVKFLGGIMGRNWIHLRDGSGSREAGNDDLTVTTDDSATVGDIVVVTGKLELDKDFGAGYRYPVIIQNASVKK
jgi:hypothetical protein